MDMTNPTYTMLKNPLGETRLWIGSSGYNGASSDNNNYYNANTHFFRGVDSSERARINSNGVDAKSGGFLINGTSVINSSRNIHNVGTIFFGCYYDQWHLSTYFLSTADSTPAGTTFANAFNGSTRAAYFDGDTTTSVSRGSGNTPYAAIMRKRSTKIICK